MATRYQVRIKDHSGAQVALLTDETPEFASLYYTHLRNTPGQYRLEVDGSLASLFGWDYMVEVQRRAPEFGIEDWYTEWAGFHTTQRKMTLEDGTRRFISEGSEYLDLVRREEMGYKAGSAFVDKSGPGETVIKAFVNENVGPGASHADRLDSGVRSGLSIQVDMGRGSQWSGSRAWKPLLENIQEVANATGLAFDVVGIGPALFEFRVYVGQRGADRSRVGLDLSTGLNGAGNKPVVFSTDLGNMKSPSLQETRSDEVNVVYVLGSGVDAARNTRVVKDEQSIAASPWNRRVISRNASQESTNEALDAVGAAVLMERKLHPQLMFTPMQTFSTVYGKHYFFGDLIAGIYEGDEYTLEVATVECTVNKEVVEDLRIAFR